MFSSSRFGVRAIVVPSIFMISPQHFSIPETSETLTYSPTKFFGMWDKKISTETLVTPTVLFINFFDIGIFLKHSTDGFANEIFRQCETLRRKRLIPVVWIYAFDTPPKKIATEIKRIYTELGRTQQLHLINTLCQKGNTGIFKK